MMSPENFYGRVADYAAFIQAAEDSEEISQPSWMFHAVKRAFDLVSALAGLLMLLPLLPFIILLIKVETPGPVLFRQRRVGQDGRLFDCFKFRSMVADAEARKDDLDDLNEATGAAFKIRNDPRITGVGRFLRRSSLDEFPQLLNILRGEMAVVGPRPQIASEVDQYTPRQALRLRARPGLTCLWQVSGRSHLDFDEWMELDGEYVRRRSLALDLEILARTLPAVMERKGAY
jgi:lipopolysaccharide/colanic/teichoic acid biosynthesis glycosyltransferase